MVNLHVSIGVGPLWHFYILIFLFIYFLSAWVCFYYLLLLLLFWSKRIWRSLWADETIRITWSAARSSWRRLRIRSSLVPFTLWANQDVTPPLQRVQIEVGDAPPPPPVSQSYLVNWQTSMSRSRLGFVLFAVFDDFFLRDGAVNPQLWVTWLGSH